MEETWNNQFRRRMDKFSGSMPKGACAFSIKIRVLSGCFHREHSPIAYQLIDEFLNSHSIENVCFKEHESGPEILVWVTLGTTGISLATSVINLIVTIIRARSEGIKKGDHPSAPIELIIRRTFKDNEVIEENILRFEPRDKIDSEIIEKCLVEGLNKLTGKESDKN